jgi:hypothetical protein
MQAQRIVSDVLAIGVDRGGGKDQDGGKTQARRAHG